MIVIDVSVIPPDSLCGLLSPRSKSNFKILAEIINDCVFQEYLKSSMVDWNEIRSLGLDVLDLLINVKSFHIIFEKVLES